LISVSDRQRTNLCFSASRIGRLAVPFLLALLGINCGETYRPIAQPIAGPSPTPAPVGHILALAANGSQPANPFLNPGSMGRIDVAGDSMLAVATTGLGPVHAALTSDGSKLYVANSSEDTVSVSP